MLALWLAPKHWDGNTRFWDLKTGYFGTRDSQIFGPWPNNRTKTTKMVVFLDFTPKWWFYHPLWLAPKYSLGVEGCGEASPRTGQARVFFGPWPNNLAKTTKKGFLPQNRVFCTKKGVLPQNRVFGHPMGESWTTQWGESWTTQWGESWTTQKGVFTTKSGILHQKRCFYHKIGCFAPKRVSWSHSLGGTGGPGPIA